MPRTYPRITLENGKLYYHYSGPFKSKEAALNYVDSLFAEGEISESDKPIYKHHSIYLVR